MTSTTTDQAQTSIPPTTQGTASVPGPSTTTPTETDKEIIVERAVRMRDDFRDLLHDLGGTVRGSFNFATDELKAAEEKVTLAVEALVFHARGK